MAFASNFDTLVTDLRYRIFTWTLDTIRFGLRLEMTIVENKLNNTIDIHVEVRTAATGDFLRFYWLYGINVDHQMIQTVLDSVNTNLAQYGINLN